MFSKFGAAARVYLIASDGLAYAREWEFERVLEAKAATMGPGGRTLENAQATESDRELPVRSSGETA